jgi:carbon-monoxide dehydrogenase small subunit
MACLITLTVNGETVTRDVPNRTSARAIHPRHLRLTGTHVGCDTAQCGACTVHMTARR